MADEIAQVVEMEYKGAYYLFKGTKAMIAMMARFVKALTEWKNEKYLSPGIAPGKNFRRYQRGHLRFWSSRRKCLKKRLSALKRTEPRL